MPDDLQPITAFLTQAGQRPYTPGSPAGWPDTATNWNGGDALLKRIELAAAGAAAGRSGVGDRIDPLTRAGEVLGALGEHTTMAIRDAEIARKDSRCCSRRPSSRRGDDDDLSERLAARCSQPARR